MIRTLRKKFIVTAMIAVTVLLLALLGAINAANAVTNRRQIDELLTGLCETEAGRSNRAFNGKPGERGLWEAAPTEDALRSACFFTVQVSDEGEILRIGLAQISFISEDEAEELYRFVSDSDSGWVAGFRYRRVALSRGSATVFLDVSEQKSAVLRVAVLSALGGLLSWGLMLLFVMFLSRKAIAPVAESMEKQKRFVTDAGHELKTPLAIIQANTEAMELTQGESKYSRNIRAQVQRLSELTQNLLILARADESSAVVNAEDFSLSELAAESLRPFAEPAALKGIRITSLLEPDVRLRANRQQIGQILSILLDNAVKYCPEGGQIALTLRKEGKAVLQLRNTASQADEPVERLFDRFYRADSARSQKTGGSGIGLSAARALAELHKGSLKAAYENGDTIVFTLKL